VLLSSHLLAEVQATADHLVIIDQGRVVASGTQHSLLAGPGQTLEELFLSLTTPKQTVA
jgi:ABC-2 type transport system ATP-binding protein